MVKPRKNISVDSLTDRIHTYVDNLNWTTPQLTYDDSIWNIHPVEVVGHLGHSAVLLTILVLTLLILIVVWCYRHALFKACRPIFQVTNTPSFPQQLFDAREVRYINSPVQPSANIQIPSESTTREYVHVNLPAHTASAVQGSTDLNDNTPQPTTVTSTTMDGATPMGHIFHRDQPQV